VRKIEWWAVATLVIAFVAFYINCAYAETIVSTHHEEQAARNAAIVILHDKGCTLPSETRIGDITLTQEDDGTLTVTKKLKISCLEWRPSPPAGSGTASSGSVLITWTAPTTRADGSPLDTSEIDHYTIYEAGHPLTTTSSLSATLASATIGPHSYTLTTTDTNGIESAQSYPVSITIK
jgi:hypothetical protein